MVRAEINEAIEKEEDHRLIRRMVTPSFLEMCKDLADNGDVLVQEVLGRLVSRTLVSNEIDHEKSLSFMRIAANAGDLESQLTLVLCQVLSVGIMRRYSEFQQGTGLCA